MFHYAALPANPAKPMKASDKSPAVTSAIAVFLNGSGTSEIASLSLIAANITSTSVKPRPAPVVKARHSAKENCSDC